MKNFQKVLAQFPLVNVVAAFAVVFTQGYYLPAFLTAIVLWGVIAMFLSEDHRTWKGKEAKPEEWIDGDPSKRWENGYAGVAGMLLGILIAGCLINLIMTDENAVYTPLGRVIMIPFIMGMLAMITGFLSMGAVMLYKWASSRKFVKQLSEDLG